MRNNVATPSNFSVISTLLVLKIVTSPVCWVIAIAVVVIL